VGARKFGFNLSDVLAKAVQNSPKSGEKILGPGLQYGKTATSKIDFVSLGLALVLGTAGLPHILMRFYTVPAPRRPAAPWCGAIWLIGIFYLFTLVLGYGAAALGGPGHDPSPRPVGPTRPRRCWPTSWAARYCSAWSRPSPSPPSWRWWPA